MLSRISSRELLAPLLLISVVSLVAAAVERYAAPAGGLQLPVAGSGRPFMEQTGSLQYPRQAIDSDGVRVTVRRHASRIVSQYLSIDDFVYTVVPPEHVVAVSANAYQPAYSNVFQFVERFHPAISSDPETVLRLDPDLILVSSDGRADYTSLVRSSGVALYRMQTNFRSLAEVEQAILLTGYLTGHDESAQHQAEQFHAAIRAARSLRPQGAPRPRILGLAGRGFTYGTDSLFNDVVRELGGINVGAASSLSGFVSVSSEQIIEWHPDWIVSGAEAGKTKQVLANLLADPAIALTPAAQNGHVLVLDDRVFLPNSPFVTRLVKALAEALYADRHAPHTS